MIRQATSEDVKIFCKEGVPTCRAMVIDNGGEVVGIAGVYKEDGGMVLFSELKDVPIRKRHVVQLAKSVQQIVQRYPSVVSFKTPHSKTADSVLKHLGFTQTGFEHEGMEVYQWVAQH